MSIAENFLSLRKTIPDHVTIVAAVKTRTVNEVKEIIDAGLTDIGHNYVQEGITMFEELGEYAAKVRWHMIGDIQTNKINKALHFSDIIQTIDSIEKADAINKRVACSGKNRVAVLIEINSGQESAKTGIDPDIEKVAALARHISHLDYIKLEGLMTMGPFAGDPEESRPYFKTTKKIFNAIQTLNIPNIEMKTLSMGMSNSYQIAIEEGSNMIRLGTILFGARIYS